MVWDEENSELKRMTIENLQDEIDTTGGGGGIAFDGSTANGLLTYKDSDEAAVESTLTHDGTDLSLGAAGKMYFGPNQKSYIQSTTQSWLKIAAEDTSGGTSGDIFLVSDGIWLTSNNISIGGGGTYTGADPTITFNTDSNDGVMLWDESADSFQFNDDVLINSTERLNFGDTGTYIFQTQDGYLSAVSDGDISLTAVGTGSADSVGQIRFDDGTTTRYTFNLDSTPELDVTGDFKIDCSGDITLDCATGGDIIITEASGTYTPASDNHVATKKYVDDNAGGGGGASIGSNPANDRIAIWESSSGIGGQSNATISSAGALVVGGTITSGTAQVCDAVDTGAQFPGSNSACSGFGGGIMSFATAMSDSRLKNERTNYGYGIAELKQLSPEYYEYNKTAYNTANSETGLTLPPDNYFGFKHVGLMAQDVESIMPELVNEVTDTGYKYINQDALIFTLINAVKELEARIATLEG
jgi:hypothetical protein